MIVGKEKYRVTEQAKRAVKAVNKGYWMDDGYCSCCNKQTLPLDESGYASCYHSFCPNCGAYMIEEVEE